LNYARKITPHFLNGTANVDKSNKINKSASEYFRSAPILLIMTTL